MKTVLFASLIASASAFAPTSSSNARSTAVPAAVDDMPGAIDFRCNEFKFDPLKLSETYEPLLPFFREAELKHGRTAMLAVVGWITAEFIRLPGETFSFENVPASKDAHNILLTGPMVLGLMAIGLFDLTATGPGVALSMKGEREPGGTWDCWDDC